MPHPIDLHVGRRLRQRRTILGYSQEAVANLIGVTFQQVQKYERGVNRIGSSRLFEFAKILSVPVAYFFESADTDSTASPMMAVAENQEPFEHDIISSRETLEIVRALQKITDPQIRKRVMDLIKSLAEDSVVQKTSD